MYKHACGKEQNHSSNVRCTGGWIPPPCRTVLLRESKMTPEKTSSKEKIKYQKEAAK